MRASVTISNEQPHVIQLADDVSMAFRYIPPTGKRGFRMGSRGSSRVEEPVHRVRIPDGFWLGETPVTQAQFGVWTDAEGIEHENSFPGRPDHPAENMTWWQAIAYCAWLTQARVEAFPPGRWMACLPTEAEWEYACRAGTETDYHTGDGEAALAEAGRYDEDWDAGTRPVRQGAWNRCRLYDLHGNVWEWCHDLWDEASYRKRVDGDDDPWQALRARDYALGWERLLKDDLPRAIRGGSWFNSAGVCRSAFRSGGPPDDRVWSRGFRVCLAPGPAACRITSTTEEAEASPGAGDGSRGRRPESDAPGDAEAGRVEPASASTRKPAKRRRRSPTASRVATIQSQNHSTP